jgi:hypothetical protein
MATGKPIGEYSMKSTSWRLSLGPAGNTVIEGNFEGTATGFGAVLGTGTFLVAKSGAFTYCGAAYPDNGDINTATGTGTYESVGKHRWRTTGILQLADGRALVSEGEVDLATRSWNGKLFEKI